MNKTSERTSRSRKPTNSTKRPRSRKTKNVGSTEALAKPTTVSYTTHKLTHDQIAQRAFDIWQSKGCAPGQGLQNWLEAEVQLQREFTQP